MPRSVPGSGSKGAIGGLDFDPRAQPLDWASCQEGAMEFPRRHFLYLAASAAALPGLSQTAEAQAYPTRSITLVDTFAPGGSTGIIARIIADKLSEPLGQQIIVDSRGGGGGTVAARQIARGVPDGYTIMLAFTGTLAIAPSLYSNAGYDPRKDFAPIGLIGIAPESLVVHPSFPVHSIAELVAYAKVNPGKVSFGSGGVGGPAHLAGELLASSAGIKLVHVPYRGSGPAVTDLLGDHIPMVFAPVPVIRENVKSGALRVLGVTSPKRSTVLPDVPTISEQGLPGYEVVIRYGLVVRAGTPRGIIDRINKELRSVLATDEIAKRFDTEGVEPLASTPEEYAADIDREEAKWSMLVKAIGLKVE
jgi:tripartite-type tricarboxylate transporter receptor subunit TctC